MFRLTIPAREYWDEGVLEFVKTREYTLELEHSLVSLSKWESKWNKAFISKLPKTQEETIDYIKCMTLNDVPQEAYKHLTKENIRAINDYISAPMTATYFSEEKSSKGRGETVTAELIYYWMVALNIPFTPCENWHLNRLITLVRVCNIKNSPPKKMSRREIASRNAALNEARRKQFNTRG